MFKSAIKYSENPSAQCRKCAMTIHVQLYCSIAARAERGNNIKYIPR